MRSGGPPPLKNTLSYREVLLHQGVIQRRHFPACHMASPIENAELIAHPTGKRQFLLNQQYRQAHFFVQHPDDVANLLHDVGLDTLGRLVQNQQFGIDHQSPADCQLLLLAAGQIAATAVTHLFQHRKQVENKIGHLAIPPGTDRQANFQIFLYRQHWKDLAPLGNITDPPPWPRLSRLGENRLAVKYNVATFGANQPHNALQQSGLAYAVASHQHRALAFGDLHIQIPQCMAFTVELIE
ncbi:hypothetical protein H744_1c1423 [Photobacterium gaetbulicola Gung47]|uniref:Uncharacterized protein n=1 Tax=Photobacterium gaetbulicola Gung47 TaxID=658445 RepID=A0A0C5WTS1_9GAMM|nr:hypothetical protein H744_1c1423 [Photobacterium gaetbulicola Gung47]